jgi:hypothetical protein
MTPCRECRHKVAAQALACPNCGAPYPARKHWSGWGYEYKSEASLFGLPLLHVSFKYAPNRLPVPARGVIAIGQFAVGILTIAQFGAGVISISQFSIAVFAIAQFALAYDLVAQFGVYLSAGWGQTVFSMQDLLGSASSPVLPDPLGANGL